MLEAESSRISFLGFKVNTEEPPNAKGEFLLRNGGENVIFQEPQITKPPPRLESEHNEFSAEFV